MNRYAVRPRSGVAVSDGASTVAARSRKRTLVQGGVKSKEWADLDQPLEPSWAGTATGVSSANGHLACLEGKGASGSSYGCIMDRGVSFGLT